MLSSYIKQKILENAVSLNQFGLNDLTWEKESAKILITSLMQDDIGIIGGNVYKIDSGHLIPMYDNWSCNPNEKETKKEYYSRSKLKALDYISKYLVYPNEKILFSLGFTENID